MDCVISMALLPLTRIMAMAPPGAVARAHMVSLLNVSAVMVRAIYMLRVVWGRGFLLFFVSHFVGHQSVGCDGLLGHSSSVSDDSCCLVVVGVESIDRDIDQNIGFFLFQSHLCQLHYGHGECVGYETEVVVLQSLYVRQISLQSSVLFL